MSFVAAEQELLEEAVRSCGFEDFGPDEFRVGLRTLLRSLDEDSLLNPLGRIATRHMIVRDLRSRLIAERGFREHPESAGHTISRPLVIIGLPRTGTTALQELFALDPQFQGLELWLARTPKPRPERASWAADPDFLACEKSLAAIRRHQPELFAIHAMGSSKVDECWNLMAQSFAHSSWIAQTRLGSYRRWFDGCDMDPVYRRHRRNLQLIGANEPEKRWILKDPTHLFALEAFLGTYPDACIVQTHRDPVEAIPSVCSLCWVAREGMNDGESRREYGESLLDLWHTGIERARTLRARLGSAQFFDVSFPRFRADPIGVVASIYRHFEIELSRETLAAMQAFRHANPPEKTAPHTYSLDDWSLDEEVVRERFARYSACYDHG